MPGHPDGAGKKAMLRLRVYHVTAVCDMGPMEPDLKPGYLQLVMREAIEMAKEGKLVFSLMAGTDEPDRKYLAVIAPDDGSSGLRGDSTSA